MVCQRLHAAVGQLFGEYGIARVGKRAQGDRHGVLRAAGDQHTVRSRCHTRSLHEQRAGHALLFGTRLRLVIQQVHGSGTRDHVGHAHGQLLGVRVGEQRVDGEVDDRCRPLALGRRISRPAAFDERAAADLTRHQTAPLGFAVPASDRRQRHVESVGQLPVRRQSLAGGEAAGVDAVGNGVGDGQVDRAGRRREIGSPHCHTYNSIT